MTEEKNEFEDISEDVPEKEFSEVPNSSGSMI